jgi:hypothetical protein
LVAAHSQNVPQSSLKTNAGAAGSHLVTVPAAQPMLDSSLLPDPAPMRPPFSVLFVGANMERGAQLKIKEECQIIRKEVHLRFGEDAWKPFVNFRADCFADPANFMRDVMEIEPGVLHFSCHGEARGLWFSQGFTEASAIVDALRAQNKEVQAKGGQRIQLVVVNACMSGPLARALCDCVDFVIGHSNSEVGDEEALTFSKMLYYSLGRGKSLDCSFKAAKLASGPFQLHGSCNPEKFFLPCPDQRSGLEMPSSKTQTAQEKPSDLTTETAFLANFLIGIGCSESNSQKLLGTLKSNWVGSLKELKEAYTEGSWADLQTSPRVAHVLFEGIRQQLLQLPNAGPRGQRLLEQNVPQSQINGLNMVCEVIASSMSPEDESSSDASQSSTRPAR